LRAIRGTVVERRHGDAILLGDPASGADPTLPYFSTNPTDPDVHHLFSDRPSGQQIPPENREEGTNGWPLCDHCRRLAPAGG